MQKEWLEAWTSYSVTTKRIDDRHKIAIYSGLIYPTVKAFGAAERGDIAFARNATVMKLKNLGQLDAAKAVAVKVEASLDSLCSTALGQMRSQVATNYGNGIAQLNDQAKALELRKFASRKALMPNCLKEDHLRGTSPKLVAKSVVTGISRDRVLRQNALITDLELTIVKLIQIGLNIFSSTQIVACMVEPHDVGNIRNQGASTRSNLERLVIDLNSSVMEMERLEIPTSLVESAANLACQTKQLVESIQNVTAEEGAFEKAGGPALSTAVEQLEACFKGDPDDEYPVLARILRDAIADANKYHDNSLTFQEALEMAFVIYSNYPQNSFERENDNAKEHVRKFGQIMERSNAYCEIQGHGRPAAKMLVARIWLMANICKLATQPPSVRMHKLIFIAYLDLFFQKHTHDKKRRDFIEAPLVYWKQGIGELVWSDFSHKGEPTIDFEEIEEKLDWPGAPQNQRLLKAILEETARKFEWNLVLDSISDDYSVDPIPERIGRKCRNEYEIANAWENTTHPQDYAFNQVFNMITPPAVHVPPYERQQGVCA